MPAPPIEPLVAQVVALFNAGRRDEAQRLCRAGLDASPQQPVLNHLWATLCLDAGDAHAALRHAELSLLVVPHQPAVLALAVRAARAAGELDAALRHAGAALALAPASIDLAREHAALLTDAGQPQLARQRLIALSAAAPHDARVHYELGRACRDAGDAAAAYDAWVHATQRDATLVPAWFALALAQQDLLRPAAAAHSLERVLELEPAHVEAHINLGLIRQELGDLDAALTSYARAHALRTDTFGRIAHALCSRPCGALWTDAAALRRALHDALSPTSLA